MFIYVVSKYFFIFQPEKVIAKNLVFSYFAVNIHNDSLISERLDELHCKTLDKNTGKNTGNRTMTSLTKYNGKSRSIKLNNNVFLLEA